MAPSGSRPNLKVREKNEDFFVDGSIEKIVANKGEPNRQMRTIELERKGFLLVYVGMLYWATIK